MRTSHKLLTCSILSALFIQWFRRFSVENDAFNDCEGGSVVSVLVAFLPFAAPFIHAKDILIPDSVEGFLVAQFMHLMVPPVTVFNHKEFSNPDYENEALSWNALPHVEDTGDIVPFHCGEADCSSENQKEAKVDLFYVGPSTHYSPTSWNADWNSSSTRYMNREAIIPQQAAIFNSVARVFAPQIRQMSGFGFLAAEQEADGVRILAANIAYSDVRAAFAHYVRKYNPDLKRGIILTGHSQGAEYMLRLLRDEFAQNPTMKQSLVAAYVIGMPVYKSVLRKLGLDYCASAKQSGCVISWQSYVDGADPSHFYFEPTEPQFRKLQIGEKPTKEILRDRLCVNPLSWEADSEKHIDKTRNKGGMHIIQLLQNFYFLIGAPVPRDSPQERQVERIQSGLLPLKKHIVGAKCVDGSLYLDDPPYAETGSNPFYMFFPVWRFASFPGSNLHPYDFNFFWADIRANAEERVATFLSNRRH